ncbi:MAG: iron complex outermembrane receptor protein [Alteromonadaceae bacterium]|jgi:iron complex outermembrane receptor protein
MSIQFTKSAITLAVLSTLSTQLFAADNQLEKQLENQTQETIEEVSVVAKKLSHANHVVDVNMNEQQSNISSVLAVMDNLPGISINEGDAFGGDDWSTSITMRGFSIDESQQQLGMTIDGIPNGGSNYGGGAKANRYIDGENMTTVEVSQGTSDISSASLEALGGTFNFVSAMPAFEKISTFAYTKGDHNASRYFARHDTGRIFDNTYAYMSYSQTSSSRWIGEGSNGGMNRQHAELKFLTELGKLNIIGRLSYDDADEDNYNAVSQSQFDKTPDWDQLTSSWTGTPHVDQMFAEGWSTLRENTLAYVKFDYQYSADFSFEISPYWHKNKGRGDWIPPYQHAVTSVYGGTSVGQYAFVDQNGSPLTPNEGCTDTLAWPSKSTSAATPSCYEASAVPVMSYRHTHYQKNRMGLTANFDWKINNNDISFGLWAENNDRDESRDWHKVIDARVYHHFDSTPYWTQHDNEYRTDTLKFYLQDTVYFGDLTVNLGVQKYLVDLEKYNKFEKAVTDKIESDSDALFSGGVLYALNDNIEFFAGYSENFSAIKDAVMEENAKDLSDIKPETAKSIDVGVRYHGNDLDISATYYTIDFDNRITFISANSGVDGINYNGASGIFRNDGGIESKGFELSANYRFNDNWSLYSSYTNDDSEYVGSQEIGKAVGFVSGDKVINSVDNMFVFSANYNQGNLRAGLSAKYTGERNESGSYTESVSGKRFEADAYTVLDLNIGYNVNVNNDMFKSFDIAFVVNNLTDESYVSAGTGNGKSFFIGATRTASVTFTADF